MKMHILAVLILSACVAQGQLPLDLDPFLVLELVRTNLNPNSFEVTLDVRAAGNRTYNVQVREGSNWLVVGGDLVSTGQVFTVVDTVGPLSTNGRTYRAVQTAPYSIVSVNEVFVSYPFLNTPYVNLGTVNSVSNQITVHYGEGIYTNFTVLNLPTNTISAFFRLFSPDKYPTNAIIQFKTNLLSGSWTDVPDD